MALFHCLLLSVFFCSLSMTTATPVPKAEKHTMVNIERTLQLTLDFINIAQKSHFSEVAYEVPDGNQSMYDSLNYMETKFRPANCAEIQLRGFRKSGVYQVYPKGRTELPPFQVYCDLHNDGGGWTVFQRRDDFGEPRMDFFRNWTDYKTGFGNLTKEFWLGNDYLSLLTTQDRMIMKVDIEDFKEETKFAKYTDFLVEAEANSYNMTFRYYSGTAGDSLKYHNGKIFVTLDRDNPTLDAKKYLGGWWYSAGHHSNLNALYQRDHGVANVKCITWYYAKTNHFCLKRSEMKLRPTYFVVNEFVQPE